MKNLFKTSVIKWRGLLAMQIRRICAIAFVAVIGFLFVACEEPDNGGGNSDTGRTPPKEDGIKPPDNGVPNPIDGIESGEYPGFSYIEENGAITITRYEGEKKDITIPSEIDGKPVTGIGQSAFLDCTNLTSVTIPNSVINIGDYAFDFCNSLTGITIPNSVTSIGRGAFMYCNSLTDVTISDSVASIGEKAFFSCINLTAIDVGAGNNSYTSENGVLYNKDKTLLHTYPAGKTGSASTIPDSVTSIGDSAFGGCTKLTSITIPNSVTGIGNGAFYGCTDLASVTFTATSKVTSIGNEAFFLCSSLTSVTIPNSVTSIGSSAFAYCGNLSITIPDSVTSIGDYAFWVSNITITWYYNPALDGLLGYYLKTVIIPDGITGIGNGAFSDCTNLTSITIPDSVTTIGNGAFSGCASLTGVTIPNSVTTIGSNAFSGCTSLTNITIPNNVTSIGSYAFSGCTSLASITIPDSVTSIGYAAFAHSGLTSINMGNSVSDLGFISSCTSLTTINVDASNTMYSSVNGVLYNKDKTELILCPQGKTGAFSILDGVTGIGGGAFSGCANLISITIPDSVIGIGRWAFRDCTSLAGITIGNGVTSLGNYVDIFDGCTGLTSVTIGSGVTGISIEYFKDSTGLTEVNIDPANIMYKSIGGVVYQIQPFDFEYDALYGEVNRIALYPPGKTGAFDIPYGVTGIGGSAFSGCTGLTKVTIPYGVTSIGYDAFSGCTSLTSVTIPPSVTSIEGNAFLGCTSLTSITIPHSVTSIGSSAFSGCTNLTKVTLVGTIPNNNFGYYSVRYYTFDGDLRDKFYKTDASNGTPGTYTTTAPVNENSKWNISYLPSSIIFTGIYSLNYNDSFTFLYPNTVVMVWKDHFSGSGTFLQSNGSISATISPSQIHEGEDPRTYNFTVISEDVIYYGPENTYWYRR